MQQALLAWGCSEMGVNLLPVFGADSVFGSETNAAVREFQEHMGVVVDGLVGPITLGKLDGLASGVEVSRQSPAVGPPGAQVSAAGPAIPVRADPSVAKRIASLAFSVSSRPQVKRTPRSSQAGQDFIQVGPGSDVEFKGRVNFKAGAAIGTADFGFFQLGRFYETYRATYRREGSVPGPDTDLLSDESQRFRGALPAQDHADLFYKGLRNGPQTVTVGKQGRTVTVGFDDSPHTPFQNVIPKNGQNFRISSVSVESFFFTGFGMVKGGQALIFATRYWDFKYCETIAPSTDLKAERTGGVLNTGSENSCLVADGQLGEKGANNPAGNAPGWGNTTSVDKTYVAIAQAIGNSAIFNVRGPGRFDAMCTNPPG